jgi:hypothetical protein
LPLGAAVLYSRRGGNQERVAVMEDPAAGHAAPHSESAEGGEAIGAGAAWRLIAPWLGYVFLAASGVLGLMTASAGADEATYDAGLATFLVALLIIIVRMRRQLDGHEIGFLLPVSVETSDSLFASIAVLGVLGLAGVVLAASVGGAFYGIGLALLVVSVALIFNDIKRYFDRRDRGT